MAKKVPHTPRRDRFTDNVILQGRSGNDFQDELYSLEFQGCDQKY